MENQSVDLEEAAKRLHLAMKKILKPFEWCAYEKLYIENLSEEEAAKSMGYKTSEKNRSPGYKQLKNIKKTIIMKVKKLLKSDQVDII